jgi:sulfate permease, SulP family
VAREHTPEARTEPGLLVYRLNAPLLFVNAKRLRDGIRAEVRQATSPVRVVLPDLSFTPELDIESVNVLASLHQELDGRGVALWLAGVRAGVRDMLMRSGLADGIGRQHLYRSVEDAVPDARAALPDGPGSVSLRRRSGGWPRPRSGAGSSRPGPARWPRPAGPAGPRSAP